MLSYVTDALKIFRKNKTRNPQHQPYPHIRKHYGEKAKYAEAADVSPPLSIAKKQFVQEVTGTFIYYAQSVDPTMLTALGSIAAQQANPKEHTMQKVKNINILFRPPTQMPYSHTTQVT